MVKVFLYDIAVRRVWLIKIKNQNCDILRKTLPVGEIATLTKTEGRLTTCPLIPIGLGIPLLYLVFYSNTIRYIHVRPF